MRDIIIVGAGGFGREVAHIIEGVNKAVATWRIKGFIDDNPDALDGIETTYCILGPIKEWNPSDEEFYVIAIASPKVKEKIVLELKMKGAKFASIIDPSVSIGSASQIGEGVVMFGMCGISVNVEIGDFVFLNSMVGVGHDANIGAYSVIGPKCCISGYTKIGKGVTMGALASTYPGITVGDYATIGMNSSAIRRVKPNTTVVGVPAKVL